MIPQEFEELAFDTGKAMANAVWMSNAVAPLLLEVDDGARPLGTGSYVRCHGTTYLLTAKHVVDAGAGGVIQHLPVPDGRYRPCDGPFASEPLPVDIAIARVDSQRALIPEIFDATYSPVEHELLFLLGFPGSPTARRRESVTKLNRHREQFGTFPSAGLQFITQAFVPQPEQRSDFDPRMHVAVHYPPAAKKGAGEPDRDLPNPDGLSGSLLWDTKRVFARRNKIAWDPSMARVCGLVHSDFDESEFVAATRIEHVREALMQLVRRERAYLHWLDRGSPLWDDLTDWQWSEETFTELAP